MQSIDITAIIQTLPGAGAKEHKFRVWQDGRIELWYVRLEEFGEYGFSVPVRRRILKLARAQAAGTAFSLDS